MSDEKQNRQYGEKPEKQEKEEEKHEKSWEEKWRRDPLTAAVWALILTWLGVALLADSLGLFDSFEQVNGWSLFFAGAGVILLLEVAFRLMMPEHRQPIIGNIILAMVFLAIGLGSIVNWGIVWGLVIIGIGLYVLYTGMFRRKE